MPEPNTIIKQHQVDDNSQYGSDDEMDPTAAGGTGTPQQTTDEDDSSDAASQFQDDDLDNVDSDVEPGGEEEKERDELKEIQKLAQRETTRVRIWKAILLVIILATAALVTVGTYRILTDVEEDDFQTAYDLFSNSIQDAIVQHYRQLKHSLRTVSVSITGAATAQGEEFPFVTLKDYEVLGESARSGTGIEVLGWGPYVRGIDQSVQWGSYSEANSDWIQLSRSTIDRSSSPIYNPSNYLPGNITPVLWAPVRTEEGDSIIPVFLQTPSNSPWIPDVYQPLHQMSPPPFANFLLNYDINSVEAAYVRQQAMVELNHGVFSGVEDASQGVGTVYSPEDHERYHESLIDWDKSKFDAFNNPHTTVLEPIYKVINDDSSEIVGHVQSLVAFDAYVVDLLPEGVQDITLVLDNNCGKNYTYNLLGKTAFFLGEGDFHEKDYNDMEIKVTFFEHEDIEKVRKLSDKGICIYEFHIYPTKAFEDNYTSSLPMILSIVVGCTFVFMAVAFFMYDWFVQSRNTKVVKAAAQSSAIVSSMFPSQIRDQLLARQNEQEKDGANMTTVSSPDAPVGVSSLLGEESRTIADFYPETTIFFSDIVGFTAWSSVREPAQVFELLESVYATFDRIAKKRRIFKVETVGDSYVAVCGLPEPRRDHAVAMARFARECMTAMKAVVKKLELTLGPETSDLSMRFGLHSGPVTAGVLRGDRARFQLFGDTMNTASRMESTGKANRIQVSQDTADLLRAANKGQWLAPREEMISVKGKGMMVTYWLSGSAQTGGSSVLGSSVGGDSFGGMSAEGSSSGGDDGIVVAVPSTDDNGNAITNMVVVDPVGKSKAEREAKIESLVKWNTNAMIPIIQKILVYQAPEHETSSSRSSDLSSHGAEGGTVLDEVKEVISMPEVTIPTQDWRKVDLKPEVTTQLHDLISAVASMYKDNAFHSFEHASHVAMAVMKLTARVVNPKISGKPQASSTTNPHEMLHGFTYGITSDPLLQLACVFSAIIHDLDHPGVSNATLAQENSKLAEVYKRSIAEQNSFDIAWALFMDHRFVDLRNAICRDDYELKRFRQVVVNMVMATDILDKELNGFRNKRWERAFGSEAELEEAEKDKVDRKATIVIEHMIQAADVAHTMQHWHVYKKWNFRLFCEMTEAFQDGRTTNNPAEGWYKGELGFFDFYIIPLAKKLADCGVFGVSSDEYLSYAERNRKEWEERGRQIVEEYVEAANEKIAAKKKASQE